MWLSKLIPFRVVLLSLGVLRQWAELLKVFEPGKCCGLHVATGEGAMRKVTFRTTSCAGWRSGRRWSLPRGRVTNNI
ncbi:hypothetical protein JG688_00015394 [Phytophthora aleatoria]|uniref:Secreted protein n=1 Tax=Phytophthora aleatoria TaxID=2496075 RepID=A0A8J5LWW2_9STRA|nr:hypothetical protein JG688_00015394 [Phytophthora aleatoria]